MRRPYLALGALVAALGCSTSPTRFAPGTTADATTSDIAVDASTDAAPTPCTPGRWCCNGSSMAYRSDESGAVIATERCTAGSRCLGGATACGVCQPGVIRCNPANPSAPQVCNSAGTAWDDRLSCDVGSGERCQDGVCVRNCQAEASTLNSYLGCEYWATPTPNSGLDYRFSYAVVLANPGTREAHVSITGGPLGAMIERTVAPGSVERVDLPWIDVLKGSTRACHPLPLGLDCSSRSAYGRLASHTGAYRVLSDIPLAVYQFNPLEYRTGEGSAVTYSYTADASLLLPQNVLGDPRNQEYLVVTRPNWSRDGVSPPYGAFVSIVAGGPYVTPDGGELTTITVDTRATVGDPSNRARELPPGRYTFQLNRGEVLQLVGTRNNEDLTGTAIRANAPIAVFTGHDCTFVPASRPACDHLEEQLLPAATWGRRYAVTFLRERVADPTERSVVRILSQADGNALTFAGISTPTACARTLDRGEFCEFETAENFVVTGSKPLLVTQFMIGQGTSSLCATVPGVPPPDRDECVGDPAMVFEVPVEQFRDRYDVLIPSTYRLNYVNITAPEGADLALDGNPLDPADVRGPFPVAEGLEVRVVRVPAGTHTFTSRDGRPFGAKVYGVAAYTSYMYSGGMNLSPINPPG